MKFHVSEGRNAVADVRFVSKSGSITASLQKAFFCDEKCIIALPKEACSSIKCILSRKFEKAK